MRRPRFEVRARAIRANRGRGGEEAKCSRGAWIRERDAVTFRRIYGSHRVGTLRSARVTYRLNNVPRSRRHGAERENDIPIEMTLRLFLVASPASSYGCSSVTVATVV